MHPSISGRSRRRPRANTPILPWARSAQSRSRLLELRDALALGIGAAVLKPVLAVLHDRQLRVLAGVHGAIDIVARRCSAEALTLLGVPIQNGELRRVALVAWTEVPCNMQGIVLRHTAATAGQASGRVVVEVQKGEA